MLQDGLIKVHFVLFFLLGWWWIQEQLNVSLHWMTKQKYQESMVNRYVSNYN